MALDARTVIEIRDTGNKLNGAGYNPANVSATKVDYSQQDSPILSINDLACTGATTTVTTAAAGLNNTMEGNLFRLASGAGFTTGYYELKTVTNATTAVLDRSPAAGAASGGTGRIGGASLISDTGLPAEGDFSSAVAGMKRWLKAGAYSLLTNPLSLSISSITNPSVLEGYNTTRGDCSLDPTLQRPVVTWTLNTIKLMSLNASGAICRSIEFDNSANTLALAVEFTSLALNCVLENCVITCNTGTNGVNVAGARNIIRNNYIKAGSASSQGITLVGSGGHTCEFNHVRSVAAGVNSNSGIATDGINFIRNNTIEKFTNGVECGSGTLSGLVVEENIIHRNTNGLNSDNAAQGVALLLSVRSNIFSRNTNAVRYAPSDISANPGVIEWMKVAADCNFFYGNTADYANLPAGSNDTILAADPFVNEAAFDFALNFVAGGGAAVRSTPCAIAFADGINGASIIGGGVGSLEASGSHFIS